MREERKSSKLILDLREFIRRGRGFFILLLGMAVVQVIGPQIIPLLRAKDKAAVAAHFWSALTAAGATVLFVLLVFILMFLFFRLFLKPEPPKAIALKEKLVSAYLGALSHSMRNNPEADKA